MSANQGEAERLYLAEGWTMVAIAQKLGVNPRTIERWAKDGEWTAKKKAGGNVVSISQSGEPPRVRRSRGESISDLDIVETAIADISGKMADAGAGHLGSLATALVKLLEFRRKIQPPTAAELADQMLALEIPPSEIIAELKTKWLRKA